MAELAKKCLEAAKLETEAVNMIASINLTVNTSASAGMDIPLQKTKNFVTVRPEARSSSQLKIPFKKPF